MKNNKTSKKRYDEQKPNIDLLTAVMRRDKINVFALMIWIFPSYFSNDTSWSHHTNSKYNCISPVDNCIKILVTVVPPQRVVELPVEIVFPLSKVGNKGCVH